MLKLVALLTLPGEQLGSLTCRWDSVCVRVVLEVASPETGVQGVLGLPEGERKEERNGNGALPFSGRWPSEQLRCVLGGFVMLF